MLSTMFVVHFSYKFEQHKRPHTAWE